MDNKEGNEQNLEKLRAQLSGAKGKGYWRSLEELSETDEFRKWADDEFPYRSSLPDLDRRTFIKFMGASMALAGLAGCRNLPQEKIVPYVKAPDERFPGEILYYATAMPFAGYGFGLLIASREGRPNKAEGNPDHPMSLGATDIFSQAELLQMYDPERSQIVARGTMPSTWEEFIKEGRANLANHAATKGEGLRLLTEPVTSPTLYAQIQAFLKAYPSAKWHQYTSINRDSERQGAQLAFGKIVDSQYRFADAKVILSFDGDFLSSLPQNVRPTREFSKRRSPESGDMNRLYCVESTTSLTGSFADHRAPIKPSEVEDVVRYFAAQLGVEGGPGKLPNGLSSKWVDAAVKDLLKNRGSSLVVTGETQPPVVHALVHAINAALGNVGKTVTYTAPVEAQPVLQFADISALARDMHAGHVQTLIILGGNPVYDAPADARFGNALKGIRSSYHLSLSQNETSQLCTWQLPESHFLEAWGDVRSWDGTASIIQPLISPLFETRSAIETMSDLLSHPASGYDLVRNTWKARLTGDFEKNWREVLNRGVAPNSAEKPVAVTPRPGFSGSRGPVVSGQLQAVFLADPSLYDGRYANNGWLQELPKAGTKLTWDNAAVISLQTAIDLGVVYEDNVTISANNANVTAPVFIEPGHPDGVITLHLGNGRTAAGQVGNGCGFNFGVLRTSAAPGFIGVSVAKAAGKYGLASTQTHYSMENRDIIREGTFEEFRKNPSFHEGSDQGQLFYNLSEEWSKSGVPQWGMTIDLNTCTGCNACVIACQAENNIPTVGKDQVLKGRALHWIRVDRYYKVVDSGKERDLTQKIGQVENFNPTDDEAARNPANVVNVCMPVPCMHCETAPCEPVCPVAATIHSHEGLNQMVYNRCVGTRYCSNNCPYKVRRFNYYNYQFRFSTGKNGDAAIPLLKMLNNPDVTVRSRGVMEKCTYCVQRINRARIDAKKEGREIRDGEVVTACAQACAAGAISFGNIADPAATVQKLKLSGRNYGLFDAELNTRPRTTYLTKVRNPNPEIAV